MAPELPAVFPARAAQLDQELNEAFAKSNDQTGRALAAGRGEFVPGISDPADPKWVNGGTQPKTENPDGDAFSVGSLMSNATSNEGENTKATRRVNNREIEIAHALNDLISGHTRVMHQGEAEGVVAGTGHSAAHVIPLLMADIITTEFTLSPCFSDDEIYDVATTILDNWSEDVHVRRQTALDAIVEHRSPEPEPETTASGMKCIEPGQPSSAASHPLTYRRLLTIAALQGLCANPAYCHVRHDLPLMAIDLANDVIDMQEGGDAD